MKPSYILNVTYAMATVMAKIHSPAVAMSAPRSMFLAVCDTQPCSPKMLSQTMLRTTSGTNNY
jgi:hypothetical protein